MSAARLLLIGTGSPAVAFVPFYTTALSQHSDVDTSVVLTETATRWVSVPALTLLSGDAVAVSWDPTHAAHIELATWATDVAVVPATLAFCAQLSQGVSTSLALATVLATSAPVTLFPSLPGAASDKPVWRRIRDQLEADGYAIVGPQRGRSLSTGAIEAGACPAPGDVLKHLQMIAAQRTSAETVAPYEEKENKYARHG